MCHNQCVYAGRHHGYWCDKEEQEEEEDEEEEEEGEPSHETGGLQTLKTFLYWSLLSKKKCTPSSLSLTDGV